MPAVREGARGVDGVAEGDGRRGPTMEAVDDGQAAPGEAEACPDRRMALLAVELGVRLPLEVALSLADHLRVCAACRGDTAPRAASSAPDPAPAEAGPSTPAFAPSPTATPVVRPGRRWSGARHVAAVGLAGMTAAVVFVAFGLVGRGGPARRALVEGLPEAPRQTLAVSGTTSAAPASAAPAVASRAAATATPQPATVAATRSRPSAAGTPAASPPPQSTGAATPAPSPAPSPSPSPTPPLPLPLPTPPPF